MMFSRSLGTSFLVISFVGLAACSSGTTGSGAPDASTVSDAGGGSCTTVTDVSSGVARAVKGGTGPTPAGGTIMDGTYVLTAYDYYGTSGGTQTTYGTLRFSSGLVEEGRMGGASRKMSLSTTGSTVTYTTVCDNDSSAAVGVPFTVGYTATSTTYMEITELSGTTKVKTFARQ